MSIIFLQTNFYTRAVNLLELCPLFLGVMSYHAFWVRGQKMLLCLLEIDVLCYSMLHYSYTKCHCVSGTC